MDLYVGSLSHDHDPSPTFGTLTSSAVSHGGRVERFLKPAKGMQAEARGWRKKLRE